MRSDVQISVDRAAGRCAWCHDSVASVDRVACGAGLAAHHAGCWIEDERCAACGATGLLVPASGKRAFRELRATNAAARERPCAWCGGPVKPAQSITCTACFAPHHPGCCADACATCGERLHEAERRTQPVAPPEVRIVVPPPPPPPETPLTRAERRRRSLARRVRLTATAVGVGWAGTVLLCVEALLIVKPEPRWYEALAVGVFATPLAAILLETWRRARRPPLGVV